MTGEAFRGEQYGIPPGPWETFAGPEPVPAMEYRITGTAPAHWRRGWVRVPDARTMLNVHDQIHNGRNFHGFEIRRAAVS